MDYAELVKELRGFSSWEIEPHKAIMKKSADAIEQLTAELEYTKRQYDLAVEDLEKIGWGEWIPVTERLPDKAGSYLVCQTWDMGGKTIKNIIVCSYSMNLNKTDKYNFNGKKYKRPGWFNYDSEYGYYECGRDITHWMPLPTPPKEETE